MIEIYFINGINHNNIAKAKEVSISQSTLESLSVILLHRLFCYGAKGPDQVLPKSAICLSKKCSGWKELRSLEYHIVNLGCHKCQVFVYLTPDVKRRVLIHTGNNNTFEVTAVMGVFHARLRDCLCKLMHYAITKQYHRGTAMTISDVHLLTGHEPGARGARAAKFQQLFKKTRRAHFFLWQQNISSS